MAKGPLVLIVGWPNHGKGDTSGKRWLEEKLDGKTFKDWMFLCADSITEAELFFQSRRGITHVVIATVIKLETHGPIDKFVKLIDKDHFKGPVILGTDDDLGDQPPTLKNVASHVLPIDQIPKLLPHIHLRV